MNWALVRNGILILASLALLACSQGQVGPPAQYVFLSTLQDEDPQKKRITSDLVNSDLMVEQAWGELAYSRQVLDGNGFIEALPHLEESEYLMREVEDRIGISTVLYLRAHTYWNLGAASVKILEFSKEAMSLADSTTWPTYAGNYCTYLLDLGYAEEALALSDTLLPIYEKRNYRYNEAIAVRAAIFHKLHRDSVEVDALMSEALANLDGLSPMDIRHIYDRGLQIGRLSQEALAECILFGSGIEDWDLQARARLQFTRGDLLFETEEESEMKLIQAFEESGRQSQQMKEDFLDYELQRAARIAWRLKRESQFRLNAYIGGIILLLVVIAALVLLLRNQNIAKEARINEQDANLLLENYRNRIRPHFLFNQLNNVNGFINQDKWEEAQEYIGLLSTHLRSLLENNDKSDTTVKNELGRLKNYIVLQQKSSYGHVAVDLEMEGESGKAKMPSGLIQPLVENSFKYAGSAKNSNATILVRARSTNKKLIVEIQDSGFGFLERLPGTGSGLALVKERIEFNKSRSRTPKLWSIETDFGKRKSTVKLTMPLSF